MWWEVDQKEARVHLKSAVDKMLSGLRSDDKSDLAQKIKLSQRTLETITKLDGKLAQDLVIQIAAAADDGGDGPNRKENPELAELFTRLGLQVVEKNPETAMATCDGVGMIRVILRSARQKVSEAQLSSDVDRLSCESAHRELHDLCFGRHLLHCGS